MRLALLTAALVVSAGCNSAPVGPVSESGTLEDGDMTLQSGEFFDSYNLFVEEGQWISVAVTARGFDPYLILQSPSEVQSEMDDSEEGDTSTTRMSLRASESGRWTALVTSFAPEETGSYSVTYEVSDTQPEGPVPSEAFDADGVEMQPADPVADPKAETIEA